jgi:hypothetical protein
MRDSLEVARESHLFRLKDELSRASPSESLPPIISQFSKTSKHFVLIMDQGCTPTYPGLTSTPI